MPRRIMAIHCCSVFHPALLHRLTTSLINFWAVVVCRNVPDISLSMAFWALWGLANLVLKFTLKVIQWLAHAGLTGFSSSPSMVVLQLRASPSISWSVKVTFWVSFIGL